jgi:primosomal protein N' (replication factor Y)
VTFLPTTCSVALPIPSPEPYDYQIPRALADRVVPGARVVVPVRSRELVGIVVEVHARTADDLKPILLAPDPMPLLPTPLLTLAEWVSRYYASPIGLTMKAMLPGALWGASRLFAVVGDATNVPGGFSRTVVETLERAGGRAPAKVLARKLNRPVWDVLQRLATVGAVQLETEPPKLGPPAGAEQVVVLARALPSLLERDQVFGRARRQRETYETIDALGGEVTTQRLTSEYGFSRALVRGLVERGLARVEKRERLRDPFEGVETPPPAEPTGAQRDAVQALRAVPPGEAATLFGVTGSGKTFVYLEAIREAVEQGGGAMVLVPEIALTPQTVARVRGVFGDTVAVLHSGLSGGERADAWRGLLSGERRVVVGARSAVFAPVCNLSAIIVDEEHDASYKHGELPRYHARDVALRRARLEGARAFLGSATPALETWAARDRIQIVSLPNRVTASPLPAVRLVDMRTAPRVKESGAVPWSTTMDEAVRDRLSRHEQIILLLNRRGFAHFLQCPSCGQVPECPSCSIVLTVHRTPPSLRCHYCGHQRGIPESCEACGEATQRTRGVGTQLLERWLAERFPGGRLARMDADTTATKWSHRRILEEFARHEVDLLFGTQMIAKGLDFPGVTLVGVVDADSGLHLPDFRAAERTFQLIAQVAGRAGRGPAGGEVLVQTRNPHHYALKAAAAHDFEQFAQRELEERREPAYPPHVGLVNIVVSGRQESEAAQASAEVADWFRGLITAKAPGAAEVLGPAPAPLARIKERWRWHLIVRSQDRALLGGMLRYAAWRAPHVGRGRGRVWVIFDRDPLSLL